MLLDTEASFSVLANTSKNTVLYFGKLFTITNFATT